MLVIVYLDTANAKGAKSAKVVIPKTF